MSEPTSSPPSGIEVLEGLEPVRCRPQLYVGPINDPKVPTLLLRQALCHAIDEAFDGRAITVCVALGPTTTVVEYNAGIPILRGDANLSPAEIMLTQLYACKNLKKHVQVGGKYCDAGLAVLNALSSELTADICFQSQRCVFNFRNGEALGEPTYTQSDAPERTRFRFQLDSQVLQGNHVLSPDEVRSQFQELQAEVPGLSIEVTSA